MRVPIIFISLIVFIVFSQSCERNKLEEKGFSVTATITEDNSQNSIAKDSVNLETRPSNVLLTSMPNYRLATIYKVNYNKDKTSFIGSNSYHVNYSEISQSDGNQWNYNYLPGFEALSGYNLVNVAHFNINTEQQKTFFDSPVLVRTLYFPSLSRDTLNYQPVTRDYFMLSVYDKDTNKDGRLDTKDLRHFYFFDKDANNQRSLIPENYSAFKSEYDPANDYFYIFARLDENNNGQYDEGEPVHIFWVDLKDPRRTGKVY